MISGRISLSPQRWLQLVCFCFLLFAAADTILPVPEPPPYAQLLLDRHGNFVHAYLSPDDKWRMEIGLEEINEQLIRALVVKEDRYFYYHFGVNPVSVGRAAFKNLTKGYRTSGASTITMQVARLLDPKPRTWSSKLSEMFRAFQLEWRYSKREILQLYMNLLPYGGNIEGIKAASLIYLDKFPEQLSLAEIAALAVIPNDPERLHFGRDQQALRERRDRLLAYFNKRHAFPAASLEEAIDQPVSGKRRTLQRRAPHFSRRVAAESEQNTVITTLDLQKQSEVESLVAAYSRQLRYSAIYNLSVIVVDNVDRTVVAYAGSQDFNDAEHGGQVDGVTALRSPGSTLKPLIYGIAFDEGLLTPKTTMTDLPVFYGAYQPENYDESYRGRVTVGYALAHSLNVPAVKVLDQIGVDRFVHLLSRSGFQWIEDHKASLGLSLALGGCGVSLEELCGLYASLANDGLYLPLRSTEEAPVPSPDTLLTPAAAYMVHEILTQLERPDLPRESEHARNLPKVAWKTGTSYGRRDAWSIGYNEQYTIAVWAGNFTGEGVAELSGASVATPLMLRLFTALEKGSALPGRRAPSKLGLRYVCAQTGALPASFCTEEVLDTYIPGISPIGECDHLTEVWTDAEGAYAYCTECMGDEAVVGRLYENLSPDLITFRRKENIAFEAIPPHHPDCQRILEERPPEIVHPTDGAVYFQEADSGDGVLFRARAASNAKTLSWYINGSFTGTVDKDVAIFRMLPAGRSTITCTDDQGRSASVEVVVKQL